MGTTLIGNAEGLRLVNAALLILAAGLVVAGACSVVGGVPAVDASTLWLDTVERGEFVQERRAPGRLVLVDSGDSGDRMAVCVPVRTGLASVDRIVVESGLGEGDRVILSDMSPYAGVDRVRLR